MAEADKYQCIYCKEFKPIEEFNREHVVSRMFGTYNDAFVLNEYQVCKSCNDYFCNEMESKLSIDSYEGFLRMQHDGRKHKKFRKIGQTRLVVSGENGIFKGLNFIVSSNPNNGIGLQFEIEPTIGIVSDSSKQEYNYYHLGEIPPYNEDLGAKIKDAPSPFVFFGLEQEEVEEELISKGYDLSDKKCLINLDINDVTDENKIQTQIKCKIDNLLCRLAAKNLFNYICYIYGKDFVLNKDFDNIRSFIRNGTYDTPFKMWISHNGLSNVPDLVENCHVIGTAWTVTDKLCLMGFVSWFNSITYSFVLKEWDKKELIETNAIICDNSNRVINKLEDRIINMDCPDSQQTIECFGNELHIVRKNET